MKNLMIIVAAILVAPSAAHAIPICSGPDRAARKLTCIYDGDTGWEHGRKWRLLDIDTPEIGERNAGCRAETAIGKCSRELTAPGYAVVGGEKQDRAKRMLAHMLYDQPVAISWR